MLFRASFIKALILFMRASLSRLNKALPSNTITLGMHWGRRAPTFRPILFCLFFERLQSGAEMIPVYSLYNHLSLLYLIISRGYVQ